MRSVSIVFLGSLLLLVVGFYSVSSDSIADETVAEPAVVAVPEETVPAPAEVKVIYSDKKEMRATWYGPGFHGRRTASGEIFDEEAFTCAHRSLPFGTVLRITNPITEKTVYIRVNDRGPVSRRFDLDLSRGAARELGYMANGVAKLQVEMVSLEGMSFPVVSVQ